MKRLFSNLYRIKESIGISCLTDSGGISYWRACYLKIEAGNISIEQEELFDQIDTLRKWLSGKKGVPLAVNFSGRNVLTKEVSLLNTNEKTLDIQGAFPFYEEVDYLFNVEEGYEKVWISIAKREIINDFINSFDEKVHPVCQVYLGPFVFLNVISQFNGYDGSCTIEGYQFGWDEKEGVLLDYAFGDGARMKFPLRLNGKEIDEARVFAYASAFSMLMSDYVEDRFVPIEKVTRSFEEQKQKVRFKANMLLMLTSTFLLLLLNTFIFIHYDEKLNQMELQNNRSISETDDLQRWNIDVRRNDSLLMDIGWNGGYRKSWIVNQLFESVPAGIYLSELIVGPYVGKKVSSHNNMRLDNFGICLKGTCSTLGELNIWVRRLKSFAWLSNMEISRFHEKRDNKTGLKEFELILNYEH